VETRAALSHDEFVRVATTPEDDGWLTGRTLIFRTEIDQLEGWRDWNSETNRGLTDSQRTLYALSSAIYYAHRSGGIVDWFEQDISCWSEIVGLLETLAWPEFSNGLRAAIWGQFPGAKTADAAIEKWKKQHAAQYREMLKQADKAMRRQGFTKADEHTLCHAAMLLAEAGKMTLPFRVSDAAEEFGRWIRLGSAKGESVIRVGTWLIENERGLRQVD